MDKTPIDLIERRGILISTEAYYTYCCH